MYSKVRIKLPGSQRFFHQRIYVLSFSSISRTFSVFVSMMGKMSREFFYNRFQFIRTLKGSNSSQAECLKYNRSSTPSLKIILIILIIRAVLILNSKLLICYSTTFMRKKLLFNDYVPLALTLAWVTLSFLDSPTFLSFSISPSMCGRMEEEHWLDVKSFYLNDAAPV